MKFYDAFGGIGGFRLGLERAGHECAGYCDWDKHAVACYNKNYGEKNEATNIRKLEARELPDFDLLVGGFPCQPFSLAGKRKGIDETRGTLFAELIRIARERRPSHLLFENVKGLLSSNGGRDYAIIIDAISELGYCVEWQVLNSKHFSVPQNRERVFIHGFREGSGREIFPLRASVAGFVGADGEERGSRQRVCSTLHSGYNKLQGQGETYIVQLNDPTHAGDRLYSQEGLSPALRARAREDATSSPKIAVKASFQKTVYSPEGIAPTMREGHGDAIRIAVPVLNPEPRLLGYSSSGRSWGRESRFTENQANTLSTGTGGNNQSTKTIVLTGSSVRRLTPVECERLQGFPDGWTKRAWNPKQDDYEQSDAQRYKQLGNAVTVNVIQALGEALKEVKQK